MAVVDLPIATDQSKKLQLHKYYLKAIMKPIWSYGIQLWGCAKPSDTQIIQRIQSKTLRIVFNAPWYVSIKTLHKDSRIPFVEDEIIRMTNRYLLNLTGHSNEQVNQLLVPRPQARRRLHRQWPTDVLKQKTIIIRKCSTVGRTITG